MTKGYYRMGSEETCPFEGQKMSIEMYEMLLKLNTSFPDVKISSILLSNEPITQTKFTGNSEIDIIFNSEKVIGCDHQRAYDGMVQSFPIMIDLLNKNHNFKIYTFYYDTLEKSLNYRELLKKIERYPDQIFATKISSIPESKHTRLWVIKYHKYYYISAFTNIVPNMPNPNAGHRYIFWKKLTSEELMDYDRGYYWQIIKDYNIKID